MPRARWQHLAAALTCAAAVACTGASEEPRPTATATVPPTEVPASPSPSATPAPTRPPEPETATATPTPTPSEAPLIDRLTPTEPGAGPPDPLIGPIEEGLERRPLTLDEVPDNQTGAIFVDTLTGTAELWTPPLGELGFERVDPTHRWLFTSLVAQGGDGWSEWITDRRSAESFAIVEGPATDSPAWDLVSLPAGDSLAVFRTDEELAVVDLAGAPTEVVARFTIPRPWSLDPDSVGSGFGVITLAGRVYVLELSSGELAPLDSAPSNSASIARIGDEYLRLDWVGDQAESPHLAVARFDRSGRILAAHTIDATGTLGGRGGGDLAVSPDGQWVAWQGTLPGGVPWDLGIPPLWPTVTVASLADGTIHLRATQAVRTRNELDLGWLADSSGLLIGTPEGYATLGVDGSVAALPFEVDPVPRSAPHDPDVFLLDGQLVDASANALTPPITAVPQWVKGPGRGRVHGVSEDGSGLYFALLYFMFGDGGGGPVTPLGPGLRVETAPLSDDIRLRYVGDDPLALSPRSGSTVESQPGVVVTHVAGPSDFCRDADRCLIEPDRSLEFGEAWLIHIRLEDGTEAWVPAGQFDWAD